MRVYEAKVVYSLVSLGDETRLDSASKIVEYLNSAFEENLCRKRSIHLSRPQEPPNRTPPSSAPKRARDAQSA